MKKIKLLAPILGMAAIAGAVVPMVSCTYHVTEKDVEVSVVDLNQVQDANLRIVSSKAEGDYLMLNIKWDNHTDLVQNDIDYYYPYTTTIQVDKTILLQKSKICPYGFSVEYDTENFNGYNIYIPLIHCKKGSTIEVDVDLRVQTSTYDCLCNIPNIRWYYEDKTWTRFDTVESATLSHVLEERTVFFAADLSKYIVDLDDNETIYIAARGDNGWDDVWIGLDRTNLSDVYLGEAKLNIETQSGRYTKWIGIQAPANGWSKATSNIITGHYFFNAGWDDVIFMFGVQHE